MSNTYDEDPPIKTGPASKAYLDNWDRIFGEKEPEDMKKNPYAGLSFLEAHYVRWRESDDELAKGPGAHGCYCAYNDVSPETGDKLRLAYDAWKARQDR